VVRSLGIHVVVKKIIKFKEGKNDFGDGGDKLFSGIAFNTYNK
jgi:hypothetical protein